MSLIRLGLPSRADSSGDDQDQEAEFRGITHDGTNPNIELKASYFLSDHTEEGHATTQVLFVLLFRV